jgi:uncharacterized small protein (DUF1192 family)
VEHYEDLETPYFRIEIAVDELNTLHWRAQATIVRKDTGEPLATGAQVTAHSREQALANLRETLRARIAALQQPADWHDAGGATSLVRRQIDSNNRINEIYMDLESRRKDGVLAQEELLQRLQALKKEIAHTTLELVKAVNDCTAAELLQMVASPEECFSDMSNPWYLEDIYARDALYDYILKPGAAVRRAHEKHHNRMANELKLSASFSSSLH